MRRRAYTAAFVGLTLVALAATGQSLRAEWRDDHQVMRVGYLAASGAAYDQLRLEPLRAYLESRLDLPVELVPATTYAALIDAHVTDRVQYAVHTATSYVTAASACDCIEPLALPAAFDGSQGFYAVLLARSDGPIHTIADAQDSRLAVSAADSIAGRLIPLRALTLSGVDPEAFFSEIVETASPEAAIAALLDGRADLAVGWSSLAGESATGYSFGVLSQMVRTGVLSMDRVRIVWQSPLIPFGPHAVRREVPDEIKRQLSAALSAMAVEAPEAFDAVDRAGIGGGGFVAVASGDYAALEGLIAGSHGRQ